MRWPWKKNVGENGTAEPQRYLRELERRKKKVDTLKEELKQYPDDEFRIKFEQALKGM